MSFLGVDDLAHRAALGRPDCRDARAGRGHGTADRPARGRLPDLGARGVRLKTLSVSGPCLARFAARSRCAQGYGAAASVLMPQSNAARRIAVFADYDVDGGSSAALVVGLAAPDGRAATLYVPDRIDEGYGPNDAAMAELAAKHDLIICVDCGTLSHGRLRPPKGRM